MSLAQKINYCMQYGTLKTYTLEEAQDFYRSLRYDLEDLNGILNDIIASYKERGRYLCSFTVHPEHEERFETVYQLNNFPTFVSEVVYFMLTEE